MDKWEVLRTILKHDLDTMSYWKYDNDKQRLTLGVWLTALEYVLGIMTAIESLPDDGGTGEVPRNLVN